MGGHSPQQAPDYTGIGLQTASMSLPVPLAWGLARGAPNLIDYEDFQTHKHTVGKGFGGKATQYTYSATIIMALCEGPITSVTRTWVNQGSVPGFSSLGFALFLGTTPQSPWGYMTSHHPTKARGYQGIAYLAASNYNLGQSESVPAHNYEIQAPLYNTQVGGAGDADPALMAQDFLTNSQYGAFFPAARIDSASLLSSGLATTTGDSAYQTYCRALGFGLSPFIASQEAAITVLGRWAQITNTAVFWTGYALKFVPYGDAEVTGHGVTYLPPTAAVFNLTDDDYVRDADKDPVAQTRRDWLDAYNQVIVECKVRTDDYNTVPIDWIDQSQVELLGRRPASSIQAHEICVPAMGFQLASLIGQRVVYIRNTFKFTLDARFSGLEPMDVGFVTDTAAGLIAAPVRIISIEEDDKETLTIVCEEFPGTVGSPAVAITSAGNRTAVNSQVAPASINPPIIFEPSTALAAKLNNGATAPIVVAIVSGGAAGVADPNWGGAIPNISTDGTTYGVAQPNIQQPARQGVLTATLAAYAGANPDTTNTLSVSLVESAGSLISASSSADAAAGATLCWVDGEIIGFTTATLIGPNAYSLTGLYRGLYGTTAAAHASAAQFGRLDSAIFINTLPAAYIGTPLDFKFQSFNLWGLATQDISTCAVYTYTPVGTGYGGGAGGAPQTPTGLVAAAVSGGVAVSWAANGPSDNVTLYTLYRAAGTGAAFGSAAAIWSGAALAQTDTPLVVGAGYTYFLTATNAVGASGHTAGINGTPLTPAATPSTVSATTTVALTAGQFVHFAASGLVLADSTDGTKPANGFVLSPYAASAAAVVYLPGSVNTALTGLTEGAPYWLSTAGAVTASAPSATGNGVQQLGVAESTTALPFAPAPMVTKR